MKKTISLAMIAFFLMSFTILAQNNQGNRTGRRAQAVQRWTAKDRAENMAKQLNLDDAQKAKVEALLEKQDAKRAEQMKLHREQRNQVMQDRDSRREAMRKLREEAVKENDIELEKIIGKEKMQQWKDYRGEFQKRMRDNNRSGRRTPRRNAPNTLR